MDDILSLRFISAIQGSLNIFKNVMNLINKLKHKNHMDLNKHKFDKIQYLFICH